MTDSPLDPLVEPEFLRVRPSAGLLGVGVTKIYEFASAGRLHPVKVGGRTVFAVRELRAFAAELAMAAGVPASLYEPNLIGARP